MNQSILLNDGDAWIPPPGKYILKYEHKYVLPREIRWYSKRYKKWVRCKFGMESDGATGAFDIWSDSWWLHDQVCDDGTWEDGSPITNWQASRVLSDKLREEGRRFRSEYWFWSTWFMGGGKARENGMW